MSKSIARNVVIRVEIVNWATCKFPNRQLSNILTAVFRAAALDEGLMHYDKPETYFTDRGSKPSETRCAAMI